MEFAFSERPWTPSDVLEFWQKVYGELDLLWQEKFLDDPYVSEICQHHPENIRSAIKKNKKVVIALAHIVSSEIENEAKTEELLDERHPAHAVGITNAHHGDRTTDPFDLGRDDLLFKCQKCNLKLSIALKTTNLSNADVCIDCAELIR